VTLWPIVQISSCLDRVGASMQKCQFKEKLCIGL
jgi:hypothetical protein